MKSLVLASTSPYRKALLAKLALPFTTAKPNVDETPLPNESPGELVERLAIAKARAIKSEFKSSLIIGSDQVAVFNGEILGKPHTKENAHAQLTAFSGNKVTFLTSLCVYDTETNEHQSIIEPFIVHFRSLTHEEITCYIDKEQPLDCAGSFKSEGLGICLFEKLEGNDPNALIGLPLIQLTQLLKTMKLNVLDGHT